MRRLIARTGEAVAVSSMLQGAVRFALALAEETDGAFDPTVGHLLERRGDNVEHRSGTAVAPVHGAPDDISWRDVIVDAEQGTVRLLRPLVLDLAAFVKGLAVDLAARELTPLRDFAIDAGGDLYLAGANATGNRWRVGIRHPRGERPLSETLAVSDLAVCTAGDYERTFTSEAGVQGHHIVDARARDTATASISATVVAESAMVADGLATAAFVLGPEPGLALLTRHGVEGVIVSPALERYASRGLSRYEAPPEA